MRAGQEMGRIGHAVEYTGAGPLIRYQAEGGADLSPLPLHIPPPPPKQKHKKKAVQMLTGASVAFPAVNEVAEELRMLEVKCEMMK